MKTILALFLCLSLVSNSFGAPLIYKNVKVVSNSNGEHVTVATVNVSKYQKIRIGVVVKDGSTSSIAVYGVVDGEKISIDLFENTYRTSTIVIDMPPDIIELEVRGDATYKIYIWGVL